MKLNDVIMNMYLDTYVVITDDISGKEYYSGDVSHLVRSSDYESKIYTEIKNKSVEAIQAGYRISEINNFFDNKKYYYNSSEQSTVCVTPKIVPCIHIEIV